MRQRRRPHSATSKLLLFIAGIAAFYGSYYLGNRYASTAPVLLNLSKLERPQAITDLSLQDQYGNPFSEKGLQGHWSLIIFGYIKDATSAHDGLSLITQVKNQLAVHPELQQKTRGILVTADPEIDRPEVLLKFMARYSPDFLALTGSTKEIRSTARQLGVTIKHSPEAESYRIDHSSSMALIDPEAKLIGLFTGVVDAASIASDIQLLALDKAE
ncbi:MAG: SCO family protein [Gammaproteobacteria bacterium]|nr:SCO family protein [Gammaproteobacteria bacterium]